MAITRPEKVPASKISSIDINSADAGLDQRGVRVYVLTVFLKAITLALTDKGRLLHAMLLSVGYRI